MQIRSALVLLALASVARAQTAPDAGQVARDFAGQQAPVVLESMDILRVGPHGQTGPIIRDRACAGVASLTNASFTGGSYTAQAGFAQGEMLAATYTLQPSEFPIRIDLAEWILVTSNATVQTTTQWSVLFYAGDPQTGQLISESSSDDIILPHARVGPGTAGVNIQFSVDPNDPEQIIIFDNGSHQFSVAWRIDHHNNQTGNPCVTGPSTTSNAFPCTDNPSGGLQFASQNRLFGLNCGSFGCPPNGGWAAFSSLNQLCRPGGDWVTRVNWSTVNCVPVTGACCLPSGTCTTTDGAGCATQGGVYQGDNTTCAGTSCPQPTGACCTAGVCSVTTQSQCTTGGGVWQGANTTCAGVSCPQPSGACCMPNGFCLNLTSANCAGAGGTWYGAGSACAPNNVCPTGACCLPSGSCVNGVSQQQCNAQGGTFQGVGTNCSSVSCPQPNGACCFSSGFCIQLTQANCVGAGATWAGPLTTCVDTNGNGQADVCEPAGPICDTVDFNHDDLFPDTADIDDFLAVFSGGACSTGTCGDIDFNNDGLFPDTTDIDALLSVFSGGMCL
ncbi:MAG: hypothetical protein U0637_03655 [Phycisphaerales bacterium]